MKLQKDMNSKGKQCIRLLLAGIFGVILCCFPSCEQWIDPEINQDPGFAAKVPMSTLIPAIELDMGYNLMGTDVILITNYWMQIFDHVGRCCPGPSQAYRISSHDINYLWSSIYTKQLINAKHLVNLANSRQSPYNAAVGQILTAYVLGITTDLWGDIPYSDALREYEVDRKPVFDSQEQIYETIFFLLDQAVENLNKDDSENLVDIEGDVYYGGDPLAWLNAARAIKARHALQLSTRKGMTAYLAALELCDAFQSNEDNMSCPFSESNPNPLYQYFYQRAGSTVMCSTLLKEMETNADPRIPFYFAEDDTGGISGSDPGSEGFDASIPGEYLIGKEAPTHLITYSELKFIEAEAALQTGQNERAVNAYKEAVAASILQATGETNEAWLDTVINIENTSSLTLEKIILQKRHALVGQLQLYSDWRRTGIPELIPIERAYLSSIPQRYPYPEDEIKSNGDHVPSIDSVTQPVWWAE